MRYTGPDGLRRTAPHTFPNRTLARRWLSLTEADIVRGAWRDPLAHVEQLRPYAQRWVLERDLAERTRELYQGLLDRQIVPILGELDVPAISAAKVRSWRLALLANGTGASTTAKAYRLLRAIMNTAVEDEVVPRNPCRIKGAAVEPTVERPVISLSTALSLVDAMPDRYRAMVVLAVFGSLRWGELVGLQRSDPDLDAAVVTVRRSVAEVGHELITKAPKTAAGLRRVALPRAVLPELRRRLDLYVGPAAESRVFIGPLGATPRRRNFVSIWKRAKEQAADVPANLHFHDLRHAGNHFAASSGASTRELMGRLGHSSMRAALISQHRTRERDRAIADALDAMIDRETP